MNPLFASVDTTTIENAAISIPLHISPNCTHTEKCALIAQALRSGNYSATSSIKAALQARGSVTSLILHGLVINAINAVCTTTTPEQWASGTFINFQLHVDLTAHLSTSAAWVRAAESMPNRGSNAQYAATYAMQFPVGTTMLEAEFDVILLSVKSMHKVDLPNASHFTQEARLSSKNGTRLISQLDPLTDRLYDDLRSESVVEFNLNGCKVTATADAWRNAVRHKESEQWHDAVMNALIASLHQPLVDSDVLQFLNTLKTPVDGAQGEISMEVHVLYYPKGVVDYAALQDVLTPLTINPNQPS